jgi:hypothetical protein
MKTAAKACFFVFMLALLSVSAIGGESKDKFIFGIQTGGSVGLSSEFSRHSFGGHMTKDYSLDAHFGGYFQYDLAERLSLQLCIDYQHGSCLWTFYDPGWYSDSGTDPFSLFTFNLNAVFNAKRGKILQFFFLAGGGLAAGYKFDTFGRGFNLGGGPGLKIYLSPGSRTALIFGATFHCLSGSCILRFTTGLELKLTRH